MREKAVKRRLDAIRWELRHRRLTAEFRERAQKSLNVAARTFDLDLSGALHREILLLVLAEFAFGKSKSGRWRHKRSWTDDELIELAFWAEEIVRENGEMSDRKIAKLIYDKHHEEKKFQSTDAIRMQLPSARAFLGWAREEGLVEEPEDYLDLVKDPATGKLIVSAGK
jgi:hypothetical protein